MDIEKIIKKIVDDGNIEYMHELSDMLEDTLEIIQKYDEDCYKEYELDLYKMAYGSNLTRGMAEEIVRKMKPNAEKWNINETQQIQEQFGISNINPVDFYIVMNSAYNDYQNLFNDNVEMYVRYSEDFINDEDAKSDKVFLYFMNIPKK